MCWESWHTSIGLSVHIDSDFDPPMLCVLTFEATAALMETGFSSRRTRTQVDHDGASTTTTEPSDRAIWLAGRSSKVVRRPASAAKRLRRAAFA
jgi:hypothetical protein